MADGWVQLRPEDFKNHDGVEELNRMLRFLFEYVSGDGEQVRDLNGYGTPEGSVVARIGSTYRRLDGGASTSFYVKESGTGATGWVAK